MTTFHLPKKYLAEPQPPLSVMNVCRNRRRRLGAQGINMTSVAPEIARVEWAGEGRVPLHTRGAPILITVAGTAKLTHGTCRIFKGGAYCWCRHKRAANKHRGAWNNHFAMTQPKCMVESP